VNIEKIFNKTWHLIAHASDLNKANKYVCFETLIGDVAIFNDGYELVAFDNLCPHRGARFFPIGSGVQRLKCRYHGWSYKNRKMLIPHEKNLQNSSSATLNTFSVEMCGEFVFFSVSPENSLREQLGNFYDELALISQKLEKLDEDQYIYECPAFVAVENALEPIHVPFIHKDSLAKLDLTDMKNTFEKSNSLVEFSVNNSRSLGLIKRTNSFFELNYDRGGYWSFHVFPFAFISSTNSQTFSVQSFLPLSENSTTFSSSLYCSPKEESKKSEIFKQYINSIATLNRKVFEEDHNVCKLISHKGWMSTFRAPLYRDEIKVSFFREQLKKYNNDD